ncbi:Putative ferric-chelate reductase 1 [Chelonia mydas]|uniref:Putative ferric-chelate reductase 1 n=1 Tax=Chelonia mydas TaxID=8469 RepID=M7BMD3_CHEMY|nr:Putative ferric-chelate reductase 1 [Chelonia mydas]
MEPPGLAFSLWIFAFLSVPAAGYPNGKVREACSSMMPCHGHSPQPSPKHTISVNETEFRPGDHIKVNLSGPVFEGFFIQARNAENLAGPAVGSFMLAEERISQLLTCGLVKFNASGCGSTKFCIRNPPKCDPGAAYCFFLSFKQNNHSVLIEMSGPSEGYIAFALSHDQWMNGLEDISWRVADGLVQCSFRRNLRLPAYKGRFNLDANYYIFLADGGASEGGLIHKHHHQPLITNGMYNVTDSPKDVGGSRSPLLLKLHGNSWGRGSQGGSMHFSCWERHLMGAAGTAPVGASSAWSPLAPPPRNCRDMPVGAREPPQVHRMLMLTTVLLTSIAFVLPFIYRGGWSESYQPHKHVFQPQPAIGNLMGSNGGLQVGVGMGKKNHQQQKGGSGATQKNPTKQKKISTCQKP